MLIKIHKTYREVIAVCDDNLVGKKFEEGNKVLDVRESFFKGKEIQEKELVELMTDFAKADATFNIVGKQSVETALKAGIISQDGVKKIKGIPYALVLL